MKKFSLYSVYSQSSKVSTDTTLEEIGTLEDFILRYDQDWVPTAYQRKIGEVIDYYVTLAKATNKRYYIFIVVPPRHGKSALVSGRYPSYHLSKYPSDNVLIWTHSISLSSDFSYINREILLNNDLPAKIIQGARRGRSGLKEWKTTKGGGLHASGIGSRVSGKGYELIICDDLFPDEPAALSKAWNRRLRSAWDSSINKRAQKGTVFLFPSVRYGTDDLLGYVQKQRTEAGYADSIVILNFTAIAEPNDILGRKEGEALSHLIPIDVLLDIKATTPPHLWDAQYRGCPTRISGLFFSPDYYVYGQEDGEFLKWSIDGQDYLANKKNCRFFQFWDTSVKASENSDDSACVTVAYCKIAGKWYVIIYNVWKKQLNTSQLLQALKDQYHKHPYVKKIFIEQAVSGYGLLEFAKTEGFPVAPIFTKQKSKEDRAIPMQGLYMSKSVVHIKFKNQVPCDWLPTFEESQLVFPNGKVDAIDASNYAGNALVHDLKIIRGESKEELYGIIEHQGMISAPILGEEVPKTFMDRIYTRNKFDDK